MNFTLVPFSSDQAPPGIMIAGTIERSSGLLSVCYLLSGTVSDIVIPEQVDLPQRRDRLWEETCLELFLGAETTGRYWEFNFSPSGHWNVYSFASYRTAMQEEALFSSLPSRIQISRDSFLLEHNLDLGRIIPPDKSVKIGVSAVTKSGNGMLTYWSLVHPGAQPDFHRRDCFIIEA